MIHFSTGSSCLGEAILLGLFWRDSFFEDHELKKSGSLHHVEMQQSLCTLWWETHVLQGQYMYNHIISCHLRSCHELN